MSTDPSQFIRDNTELLAPPLVPEIRLHLASEVVPLWRKTEEELEAQGVPPPYWAFAWAGGQALARFVLDHAELVRGRRVLDFGAGSGLLSIAAAKAGAQSVLAADIDSFAAAAIALNCEANRICPHRPAQTPHVLRQAQDEEISGCINADGIEDVPHAELVEARTQLIQVSPVNGGGIHKVEVTTNDIIGSPCAWDVILVGDMCYERPLAERLLAWLEDCATTGATILLGDPGRSYFPKSGIEKLATYRVQTTRELEDREIRETSVYRFTPDARPGAGPT